jgi:hypothetical protein
MVKRSSSDEAYVIDLCDEVLGIQAQRQHRFAFLRGDARMGRPGAKLPVDAFYQLLNLVIEYRERQHTQEVSIMDRRMTISAVTRGRQRALYDERRRTVLPLHGVSLVELSYAQFEHNGRGRLRRCREDDLVVLRGVLAEWC